MSQFLPLISFAIALSILFGYVTPTWSGSIREAKAGIARSEAGLAAAKQYTAQQNGLASSRNQIDQAMLARLETLLPNSVDNVGLILDLNALATRSNLLLSNIDVAESGADDPAASTNPYGSIELSLSAAGAYSAFQDFLLSVERSARLLDVRQVSVEGSNTGVYQYRMTVRLYWLK
jgi:Tfp pilus assembly protein PilO